MHAAIYGKEWPINSRHVRLIETLRAIMRHMSCLKTFVQFQVSRKGEERAVHISDASQVKFRLTALNPWNIKRLALINHPGDLHE